MERQFDSASPELMDRPQPVSAELAEDLRNLRHLNRYFGSHALVRHFLLQWIQPNGSYRVLDLATGSADIPRLIADYARQIRAVVSIDAVDRQSSTLEIARRLSADYPEIEFHEADILNFGTATSRYDLVLCSLALHHFAEEDAVRLLAHCRDLSRRFILVADLRRGLLATIGVRVLTALIFRARMTRVDARLSAARAFSFAEFCGLAQKAGWENFQHRKFWFARQALAVELA